MRTPTLYRTLLVLAAPLMLSSCFVAKNYHRPQLEETANLFRTDQLPKDSVSMASIPWKQLFTDPQLETYISEGLENNMDIRVAVQQVLAAEAYAKQGKMGYLPSLNATASVTHQELSKNSQFGALFSGSIEQYALSADLSWEADIWGKIRSNKRATWAAYLQTVAAHKAVKSRLVADIASTYYRLLALDQQLQVANETIKARENSVSTLQALKDAGQTTQVAVNGGVAQYNNALALKVDLQTAIFKAENTMAILLGKPGEPIARGALEDQQLDAPLEVGVPALLLANRPDVMAAEQGLVQNFELTNVARSNFYPTFALTATGGFQSLELDKWIDGNSLFATLVGNLTAPIFNKRRIRTQYEVAQSNQEQALLNFKKTLLMAGNEVSNALRDYEAETEKTTFRENEAEALRHAEEDSEELLNNGLANYLDLLTARQNALNAELNVIDNRLQRLLAVVNLYNALGGGWN